MKADLNTGTLGTLGSDILEELSPRDIRKGMRRMAKNRN